MIWRGSLVLTLIQADRPAAFPRIWSTEKRYGHSLSPTVCQLATRPIPEVARYRAVLRRASMPVAIRAYIDLTVSINLEQG